MKKRKIILFIGLLAFFFMGKVYAEGEDVCTTVQLSNLRSEAANVKVTYVTGDEIEETDPDPELGLTKIRKHYVYIKIFNINSKMAITVSMSGKGVSGSQITVGAENVDSEGVITLRQPASDANITYQFNVFSVYGGCSGKSLRSMRLTIPKFNVYSELDMCKDVPDYYLCLPYTSYDIDSNTVYTRIEDYKAKLSEQDVDAENSNGQNSAISRAMSSISKYKYIIVGVIVAIGVVITVIIVRRKKSVL